MNNNLDCPVDFITVNENKVRVVAFFVFLLGVLFLITGSCIIIGFLLADFLLRVFNFNTYSPLSILSGEVVKLFKLKNKPVDRAPKRFAALVGLIFLTAILFTSVLEFTTASIILTSILLLFAALESFAGFCAGCYVYSLLKKFKLIRP